MDNNSYEIRLAQYFADGTESFIPQVSINCVVFKYEHPTLKVLFHSLPGTDLRFLPGGYVKQEESLEEAAYRNLSYSGIEQVFLRQIHSFGETDRISKYTESDLSHSNIDKTILNWVTKRFITTVYYGLVVDVKTEFEPDALFTEMSWLDVAHLENIGMDHVKITAETRKILATELLNYPVAAGLLPEQFTLNELRGLFEVILDRTIDRGTFRRKMLKLGIVEQADEKKDTIGRPSFLYRFNKEAYHNLLKEEKKFGF